LVLVTRRIKVVFLVQSNRTTNQIRNYVINTVFPEWDAALTTAFSGFANAASVTAVLKEPYVWAIIGLPAGRFWVYPKYVIQADIDRGFNIPEESPEPTAQQADARTRFHNFIEDAKARTRTLIQNLSAGTSVIEIYKQNVDGAIERSTT